MVLVSPLARSLLSHHSIRYTSLPSLHSLGVIHQRHEHRCVQSMKYMIKLSTTAYQNFCKRLGNFVFVLAFALVL